MRPCQRQAKRPVVPPDSWKFGTPLALQNGGAPGWSFPENGPKQSALPAVPKPDALCTGGGAAIQQMARRIALLYSDTATMQHGTSTTHTAAAAAPRNPCMRQCTSVECWRAVLVRHE
jgi:hypothetical protein